METITLQKTAARFSIQEASQIADVRRYVSHLASELQFTEVEIANTALIVTEMGTNLIKHTPAGGDIIIQACNRNGVAKIELLALDKGPGIANLEYCFKEGLSTTQTQGKGLGAIQRLSNFFDIYTLPQQGTAVLAKLWHQAPQPTSPKLPISYRPKVGSICLPIPSETVCGDGWIMMFDPSQTIQTILVSDGLGHGLGAHEATQKALQIFQSHPDKDIASLFKLLHQALRKSRGAAITITQIDWQQQSLKFAGIGNVEGKLITTLKNHYLLSQNGIVGHEFRHVHVLSYSFEGQVTLILHSDGIKNRWELSNYPGLLFKHPNLIAGVLYRDYLRGRDDATIVVVTNPTRL